VYITAVNALGFLSSCS